MTRILAAMPSKQLTSRLSSLVDRRPQATLEVNRSLRLTRTATGAGLPSSLATAHSLSITIAAFPSKRHLLPSTSSQRIAAAAASTSVAEDKKIAKEDVIRDDPTNNVSDVIFEKLGRGLHLRPDHPLGIIRSEIHKYFDSLADADFLKFDDLLPVVATVNNFDDLLIPPDHVSRSLNDTYYIDPTTVLRTHTSAHQAQLLRAGHRRFLVTGDVYRRDAIDATHYPVFHQMEGFRVFEGGEGTEEVAADLKAKLEGLARHLLGDVEMRWVDTYFPFTDPSFELEIFFKGEWLEVLGCGVTEHQILSNCGLGDSKAWAFGLGLERLAMVLFDIPDIRLFWTDDSRFLSQFKDGKMGVKFKSYSKYPPCFKDMSFWVSDSFTENNLCELVRGIAGDLAEEVKLIDEFTNKKGATSNCYRITYRSMERSLTDEEVNAIQEKVREQTADKLKVTLR